jgi:hypothetical protein
MFSLAASSRERGRRSEGTTGVELPEKRGWVLMVQRPLTPAEREEALALLERVLAEVEAGRLDAGRAAPVLAAVRGALLGLHASDQVGDPPNG